MSTATPAPVLTPVPAQKFTWYNPKPAQQFTWYNPKTWSAAAQCIAILLITAAVPIINKKTGLGLAVDTIKGILGLGVTGAVTRAVIDHGESDPNSGTPGIVVQAVLPVDLATEIRATLAKADAVKAAASGAPAPTPPAPPA